MTPAVHILALVLAVRGAPAAPPDDPLAPLRRLRDGLRTLELTEEIRVQDRRRGGSTRVSAAAVRCLFDGGSGRSRRDLLSRTAPSRSERRFSRSTTGSAARERPRVAVDASSVPEPRWLFALPETAHASRTNLRRRSEGEVLTLRARGSPGSRIEKDILLGADGLPVRVRTFGFRDEVLDEATIRWQGAGAARFPAEITLVQRSRLNTVTTTVHFANVRVNRPLAASLFSAP